MAPAAGTSSASRLGCPEAGGPRPRAAGESFPRKAVATLWILEHGQLYPIKGQGFSRNSQKCLNSCLAVPQAGEGGVQRHFVGHGEKCRVMPGVPLQSAGGSSDREYPYRERASAKGSTGAGGGQRCPGGNTVTSLRGQEAQVPLDSGTRSGALVSTASHAIATVPVAPGCRAAPGHGAAARPPQPPSLHLKAN